MPDIEFLTGADLTDFKNAVAGYFGTITREYAALALNANQSVAASSIVAVSWTEEVSDLSGIVAVPASYVVVPTGRTMVNVSAAIVWASHGTSTERYAEITEKNTSDVLQKYLGQMRDASNANAALLNFGTPGWRPVTAGNRIYVSVAQASPGALNLSGGAVSTLRTAASFEFR